jgi:hypothetical protein
VTGIYGFRICLAERLGLWLPRADGSERSRSSQLGLALRKSSGDALVGGSVRGALAALVASTKPWLRFPGGEGAAGTYCDEGVAATTLATR